MFGRPAKWIVYVKRGYGVFEFLQAEDTMIKTRSSEEPSLTDTVVKYKKPTRIVRRTRSVRMIIAITLLLVAVDATAMLLLR